MSGEQQTRADETEPKTDSPPEVGGATCRNGKHTCVAPTKTKECLETTHTENHVYYENTTQDLLCVQVDNTCGDGVKGAQRAGVVDFHRSKGVGTVVNYNVQEIKITPTSKKHQN